MFILWFSSPQNLTVKLFSHNLYTLTTIETHFLLSFCDIASALSVQYFQFKFFKWTWICHLFPWFLSVVDWVLIFLEKRKKKQEVLCMPCTSFKIHLQLEIMLSRLLICQHFRLRRPTQSKTWFYMCGFLYLNSCQCCSLHTEFKCRFWSTDRLFLLCDDSVSELNNLIHFNTLLVPIDNVSTCVTSRAHLWWRGS